MYNGQIAPLIPYGVRGVIWYQGESNATQGYEYQTLLPTMIADWRSRWGQGDFPFLYVQLAPFLEGNPRWFGWAELREAQRLVQKSVPNTWMAVITDLGDTKDIHPLRKEPVGDRLALIARSQVYGEKPLEYSGPAFDSIKIEGAKVRVLFTHAAGLHAIDVHDATDDGPLMATKDKLVGFEVAGADQVYHAADAVIDGATIVVSNASVAAPIAVRYGWAYYPIANLSNSAGIPASPFKSDDWPWSSMPKPPVTGAN